MMRGPSRGKKRALDVEVPDQLDFDNFRLIYLSNAQTEFELELTVKKDHTVPFVLGDGYPLWRWSWTMSMPNTLP